MKIRVLARRVCAALPGIAWAWALLFGNARAATQNIWLSETDIESLRNQPARTASLIRRCDKDMDTQASPVTVFAPPPHYRKNGVTQTDASKQFGQDGSMAFRAALCFAVTDDSRYASHAQRVISAWADQLSSVSSEQGASEINFGLPQYVIAASMVRDANGWSDKSFRRLLLRIALPLSRMDRKNNHGNWGVLLNASIAAYTGDTALLTEARKRWQALMDTQVAADGSLPMEICRSDTSDYCGGNTKGINGLSYTHYTLLPTTAAARIFELQGQSVWQTAQGVKFEAAYRKAASWVLYPETFPYFDANGGRLNGVRNAAYFALLQRHYPNELGARVLAEGALGMNGLEWLTVFN